MKQPYFYIVLLTTFLMFPIIAHSQGRTIMELDSNWKFQKGIHEQAFTIDFDDRKWETVTAPAFLES